MEFEGWDVAFLPLYRSLLPSEIMTEEATVVDSLNSSRILALGAICLLVVIGPLTAAISPKAQQMTWVHNFPRFRKKEVQDVVQTLPKSILVIRQVIRHMRLKVPIYYQSSMIRISLKAQHCYHKSYICEGNRGRWLFCQYWMTSSVCRHHAFEAKCLFCVVVPMFVSVPVNNMLYYPSTCRSS